MKRSIEDTSVVFIGAGNLATNLAKALYYKGFRIVQVYSRTEESARTLAQAGEGGFYKEFLFLGGLPILPTCRLWQRMPGCISFR